MILRNENIYEISWEKWYVLVTQDEPTVDMSSIVQDWEVPYQARLESSLKALILDEVWRLPDGVWGWPMIIKEMLCIHV